MDYICFYFRNPALEFYEDPKFYYNDAARLTVAIVPLIMFESIKDLKFLSLATLIDVLTTAISDLNVGKAMSSAQNIAEKTTTTITWLNKVASGDYTVIDIDPTEEKYRA
ncbi:MULTISPECIES: hypothetical protein [spotted fever group]|uniref:Uncharacterized protein n=1 Tax=Rickettsia rhipicephali str. Ect TaxID=1359199 RepID=A0A0F3PGF1_RICRH|nr:MULTISPECIES: hypothetical protein [spotted fever group]KJV79440.1 hypothetical protein RMAECT_0179 [Rickettsia rhipicephali str. Ect]